MKRSGRSLPSPSPEGERGEARAQQPQNRGLRHRGGSRVGLAEVLVVDPTGCFADLNPVKREVRPDPDEADQIVRSVEGEGAHESTGEPPHEGIVLSGSTKSKPNENAALGRSKFRFSLSLMAMSLPGRVRTSVVSDPTADV